MRQILLFAFAFLLSSTAVNLYAQATQVVDVPTRSGVTQRFIYIEPANAKATVVLFAGGQGNLNIADNGAIRANGGNFLVRTRQLFADQGLAVAVVDAPSDRQNAPYLGGFRQTANHAQDIEQVIAWLRAKANRPVWLIGTSRGTQSVGYLATQLTGVKGPDGIVLTSTILIDKGGRPVPDMPLEKITIPVLVVHHEQDGCVDCPFTEIPRLMQKLTGTKKKELITFTGGINVGDPCEAMAYHGYNGLEKDVVAKIGNWILQ